MMASFDVLLVDLQDLGCRIYTFITTLRYVLEAAAAHGKAVWMLDRPNPAGRPVEGLTLRRRLGELRRRRAAADAPRPHPGRTGALVHCRVSSCDVDCRVIDDGGLGARGRAGLRLAAGRALLDQSEPQRAQSVDGALLRRHRDARRHDAVAKAAAPRARSNCSARPTSTPARCCARCSASRRTGSPAAALRECWFEPTFHKHAGKLCNGVQIHVEDGSYDHAAFRPWRLQALAFKALRNLRPDYPIWRDFPYEYEHDRLAIDLINGSESLRQWVDDPASTAADLEIMARADEAAWIEVCSAFLLY